MVYLLAQDYLLIEGCLLDKSIWKDVYCEQGTLVCLKQMIIMKVV